MGSLMAIEKQDLVDGIAAFLDFVPEAQAKLDAANARIAADRERVEAAIRRTRPATARVDVNAQMKRRGETHEEWRARLDNLLAGRPFGESLLPAEAERHGDYVERFVTHVETNTKAQTKRNNLVTPLDRMFEDGQLTAEQHQAVGEIQLICESIQRSAGMRGASFKARVDNEGAGRDALIESLGRVRLEVLYSKWRKQLPMPRQMYLDIIVTGHALKASSRSHNHPWRKTRKRMIDALDRWNALRERTWSNVDRDDVEVVYRKLGCGVLTRPREG
jgi:hypothetical protein